MPVVHEDSYPALESLVGGQLEDWQGPPANQGFLAGGPGHFCLFPKLLTFGLISRLSSCTCRAEPGKLFRWADSFPVPRPAPSGVCPQPLASLLVPGCSTPSLVL